ncbi:MAG: LysR family transcriptional regulator [Gammaproteobacteria bacterium]|nr:LysR family transcriptional regulator [Gammaproteobacteria bacterium]
MDRLAAIQVFLQVVDTGSFTAASVRMGLSRAAVSKYVSQLETHLAGRLLHRSTRHVSLTESGRLFYEQCHDIMQNLEEAEAAVSGLSQEPRGTLRISTPTNFASLHLVPLISRFMQANPELKVEMICSDRLVNLVDEGFDMAIRITYKPGGDLVYRRLAPCRHIIVASPDYLANHSVPETPDQLRHHACLLYTLTADSKWPFFKDGQDCSVKVNGTFISDNPDALTMAAIAGLGITMLPTFMATEPILNGKLIPVLPGYQSLEVQIYAAYASRRHLPAKIRLFIDYLTAHVTDPPYWDTRLAGYLPGHAYQLPR